MKAVSEKCGLINLTAGVLIALVLVLCFTGYWQTDEGGYSLMGYVGMPSECAGLEAFFKDNISNFNVNDVVGAPLWTFCIGLIACGLCIALHDNPFTTLAPLAWSAGGLFFYMTSEYMKLGGMYWLHIGLMALVLILSLVNMLSMKEKL